MLEGIKCQGKIKKLNRRSRIRNREGEGRSAALNGVVRAGAGTLYSTPRRICICTLTTQQQQTPFIPPHAALREPMYAICFHSYHLSLSHRVGTSSSF